MKDLAERIARLSPEQRAILEQKLKERAAPSQIPPILRRSEGRPAPLSFAQQRFWFLDRLSPGQATSNVPITLRIRGRLDVDALRASLLQIVERHEALRTRFSTVDGSPVQLIDLPAEVPLPLIRLRGVSREELEEEARRAAAEEVSAPFDLERGPIFRASLFELGPDDYVLAITVHHIAFDGWSAAIFQRELALFYEGLRARKPVRLPDLPIQYADFAAWQRDELEGEATAEDLAFWKGALAGAPPVMELPTDRPRPPAETHRGGIETVHVAGSIKEDLLRIGQAEGATLFMTLLAAFQTLLHRYTGETDLVVGTPISGRNRSELEDAIGLFLNTLPLRTDFGSDPTFREVLRSVRQTALDAYAHSGLPFERMVEELNPQRSLARSPIFQVMIALQGPDSGSPRLIDLDVQFFRPGVASAKFDLTLFLAEEGEQLRASLEYNSDLFEAETARRMLSHFETLLGGVVRNPDARVSAIPLLSEGERRTVVSEWNRTDRDFGPIEETHRLIEAQVERTPDAVAVEFEGNRLTYRELDVRANRLAHWLIGRGAGPESRVAVAMDRSLEMVVALLGVWKAGAAYVPLNPSDPPERLASLLQDCSPAVFLTQKRFLTAQQDASGTALAIDSEWRKIEGESPKNPGVPVRGANLAYLMYTSGSTGTPKGALNTHAAVANRLLWMQAEYSLDPSDAVLQKTPYTFDVSVWEFFWPLLSGARLVMARPEGHRDTEYLVDVVRRERITTMHFVPSMLPSFLEAEGAESCTSLRRVFCSGEALSDDLARRYFGTLSADLHNLYGPTEAAVDVTFWACRREDDGRTIPIGRPISNARVYLLDRRGEPVPIGVPGELVIGGRPVGRGYWRQPELTAQRFVPDPFSAEGGGRLYRTGDLARFRADGAIEFLGRLDDQVKIRGFRIEPGEVQAALAAHPAIRDSVVLALGSAGERRLVAYALTASADTPAASELRSFLAHTLPEYMIPSAFVFLERWPLTSSGKLDRRALPEPDGARPELDRAFVAPRTALEEDLAGVWAEVLGVDRVGVYDNFFDLGGHSLLAIRVFARLRDRLGLGLPLRLLFERPTIAELARAVDEARGSAADVRRGPIPAVSRRALSAALSPALGKGTAKT